MKYSFEIQNCIKVIVEADNVEEARLKVLHNIDDYANEMVEDAYVSDGQEEVSK